MVVRRNPVGSCGSGCWDLIRCKRPELTTKVRVLSMLQSHAHFSIFGGCWLILFFVCTVVARLALQQCELFGLYVDFPAIVTDCGGNVAKAFNSTLQWDWLRCGCHLIHNVVKAGLDCLKNNAANPAQQSAVTLQEALDRLVVLYVHSMVASCMFKHPVV